MMGSYLNKLQATEQVNAGQVFAKTVA